MWWCSRRALETSQEVDIVTVSFRLVSRLSLLFSLFDVSSELLSSLLLS